MANKKKMISSVVIPTYNRPESLLLTLQTLFSQTYPVDQIVIVDDSTDNLTEKLIVKLQKKMKKIEILYIKKDPAERGTSKSRNLGIDASKGEYVFFLDDDITVHKDYIESSLDFFQKNPKATAIQWYAYSDHDVKYDYGKLKNRLMKLFCLGYYAKDTSIVLRTMASVVPHPITTDIPTEYMGAGTSVIKRKYLKDVQFDENLTGYALQEDLDFSYRLHKKYGNLYLLKDRKLHHAYSLTGRMNLKKIMFTKFIYLGYIFKKNIPQTLTNVLLFWISMFARIILRVPNLMVRPSRAKFEEFWYTSQAILSLLAHFSSLERNPNYFKESL